MKIKHFPNLGITLELNDSAHIQRIHLITPYEVRSISLDRITFPWDEQTQQLNHNYYFPEQLKCSLSTSLLQILADHFSQSNQSLRKDEINFTSYFFDKMLTPQTLPHLSDDELSCFLANLLLLANKDTNIKKQTLALIAMLLKNNKEQFKACLINNTVMLAAKNALIIFLIKQHLSKEYEDVLYDLANDLTIDPQVRELCIEHYLRQHEYFKPHQHLVKRIVRMILAADDYKMPDLKTHMRNKKQERIQPYSIIWLNPNRFVIKFEKLGQGTHGSVKSGIAYDKTQNRFKVVVLKTSKTLVNTEDENERIQEIIWQLAGLKAVNHHEYGVYQHLGIGSAEFGFIKYKDYQAVIKKDIFQKDLPEISQKNVRFGHTLIMPGINAVTIHSLFYEMSDEFEFYYKYFNCPDNQSFYITMLDIFISGLKALRELHLQGFSHLDIKGNNILVDRFGNVYVFDFGLSRRDTDEKPHIVKFDTQYHAPELKNYSELTPEQRHQADVYSFGLLCKQYTDDLLYNRDNLVLYKIINKMISEASQSCLSTQQAIDELSALKIKMLNEQRKIQEKVKTSISSNVQLNPLHENLYLAMKTGDRQVQFQQIIQILDQEFTNQQQNISFWQKSPQGIDHLKELLNSMIKLYSLPTVDGQLPVAMSKVHSELASFNRNAFFRLLGTETDTQARMRTVVGHR